jgi:hypothetical protein
MGVFIGNLVIANGGTDSTAISGRILRTVRSLEIHAPAALTGTITVQSANDIGNTTFNNVQSPPGTDTVITAGDTTTLTVVPAHGIRVQSGSAEGAERTFPVFGEERLHT